MKISHPVAGFMYACVDEKCTSCFSITQFYSMNFLKFNLNGTRNFGIDVGAHVGVYGVALYKYFQILYSYEVAKGAYPMLKKNAECYKCIFPVNKAGWNETTKLSVKGTKGNSQSQVKVRKIDESTGDDDTVEAVAIDEDFKNGETFNMIKIDVEGAEYQVLWGMRDLIKRSNDLLMVVEYSTKALAKYGISAWQFIELLDDLKLKTVSSDYVSDLSNETIFEKIGGGLTNLHMVKRT